MTQDQIIIFALFGLIFCFLLWGRMRYDIVALSGLVLGVLSGVVPSEVAFSGFGHPATIIVALVLLISAGLMRSGAVNLITRLITDSTQTLSRHIALIGAIGGLLSAFINNVAALALLMPVDIQAARKAKRSPANSLMPLSFATILGGMVTLIGTPPNIIIAAIRNDALGAPFSMFDFAPVGLVTALFGLFFVATIGWRLIPKARTNINTSDDFHNSNYFSELTVPLGHPSIDKPFSELEKVAKENDVKILGLMCDRRQIYTRLGKTRLKADDRLLIEAAPDALESFRLESKLALLDNERNHVLGTGGDKATLVEVVVTGSARLHGRTVEYVGLEWRHKSVLVGISRRGKRITNQLRKTILREGDVLLLLMPRKRQDEIIRWIGCLPLAPRGLTMISGNKTWLAIGLFLSAILCASLGLVSLPIALCVTLIAFLAFGILSPHGIYDLIDWPIIVLLGSMIPLGKAFESVGGTTILVEGLLTITQGLPLWMVLGALMIVTMTLSDILNNTATTIIAAPVGLQIAEAIGANPDTFLMGVAIAASAAFLTPIGHKNNALILKPGGYRFSDYWRMGLPLEILLVLVSIPALLHFWPL